MSPERSEDQNLDSRTPIPSLDLILLRSLAEKARTTEHPGDGFFYPQMWVSPDVLLALLDRLEAAEAMIEGSPEGPWTSWIPGVVEPIVDQVDEIVKIGRYSPEGVLLETRETTSDVIEPVLVCETGDFVVAVSHPAKWMIGPWRITSPTTLSTVLRNVELA